MHTEAIDRQRTGAGPARSGVAAASVLILAFTAACTTPTPAPPRPGEIETYRVGPPDQLFISVLPEPPIERNVTVRPDGMVTFALIGDVPAAGRTTEEIAADIEERISRYKRGATVTVSVELAQSTLVTVLGEVGQPRSMPLRGDTRLIEAIGQLGGPTVLASEDSVRVIRSERGQVKVFDADLSAIQNGDLSTNILLSRGDIVVVPPTTLAKVGYALQGLLFPFQQLFGFGSRTATTVVTGGAGGAF